MKIFLLDLWHDLRQKRLWPVALALAIALVAVPVVLSKPAPEPPPPAPAPAEDRSEEDLKGLAKVVLANEQGKGSKLNLFDSSNPFKPPKTATDEEDASTSDDTGAPLSGGSSVGESVSGSPGTDFGGSIGGSPSLPQPQSPTTPKPKTTQFTYVIDLTFQRNDDRPRKINGMQRLEMLPDENAPLLLFLGVDAKANNAVFLVDSRLDPNGEGRCKPSREECSFLYLGSGSKAVFADPEGSDTYTLEIREIRKVEVKKSPSAKAGKNERNRKQARTSQYHRGTSAEERRPFVPRLLTDLVSVTENPSSTAGKSR